MKHQRRIDILRKLALAEAVSYLLLLGVAMPLKYLLHKPAAVTVVGSIHGLLFVALCLSLAYVHFTVQWPLRRAALVFIASLIPLLPFFLDPRLKQWSAESDMENATSNGKPRSET